MKVLWVCNTLPATAAGSLHEKADNKEGWLDGILSRIIAGDDLPDGFMLAIAYPRAGVVADPDKRDIYLNEDFHIILYGYEDDRIVPEIYDVNLESTFAHIIADFDPDIIHVFGTEYGHNLAVARARNNIRKGAGRPSLLIGIQGIISECAVRYTAGMPEAEIGKRTFRDVIRHDSIKEAGEKFRLRGEFEKETVTYATDVLGRTDFDRKWCERSCLQAVYHHMNETLRRDFYTGTWDLAQCDRHVIFMSQGDYPLKGVHNVLKIMPDLIRLYPDARLVVAGADIISHDTLMKRIKLSGYGRYLCRLISRLSLQDHVRFTGPLTAAQMKEQFLHCHTYLCASSLENSPNSMGEAMLLGIPVIAARTGGIPSLIEDGTEGILYDSPEGITEAVDRIWSDDGFAMEMGAHGMQKAKITHDPDSNYRRLMEIYDGIG